MIALHTRTGSHYSEGTASAAEVGQAIGERPDYAREASKAPSVRRAVLTSVSLDDARRLTRRERESIERALNNGICSRCGGEGRVYIKVKDGVRQRPCGCPVGREAERKARPLRESKGVPR
jgi:hypothetical protein